MTKTERSTVWMARFTHRHIEVPDKRGVVVLLGEHQVFGVGVLKASLSIPFESPVAGSFANELGRGTCGRIVETVTSFVDGFVEAVLNRAQGSRGLSAE